jgi:hypothetical protein
LDASGGDGDRAGSGTVDTDGLVDGEDVVRADSCGPIGPIGAASATEVVSWGGLTSAASGTTIFVGN